MIIRLGSGVCVCVCVCVCVFVCVCVCVCVFGGWGGGEAPDASSFFCVCLVSLSYLLCDCLSVCPSFFLSLFPSLHIFLSVCPSFFLSLFPSLHIFLSVCLSVCPSFFLSLFSSSLSVFCLSVCVFLSSTEGFAI